MSFDYQVEFTHFPGGVAPESIVEYVDRVDADPGITTASLVNRRWKNVDYGGGAAGIALIFDVEPTAGEKTICDNLAAAGPGELIPTASEWLAEIDGANFRGYWEDYSALTATGGGPAVRMSETATLYAGRYLVEWLAEISGSGATAYTGRFIFERGNSEEFIADRSNSGTGQIGMVGRVERVVVAGSKSFELEIEKTAGSGSAQMGKTSISYKWIGTT